MQVEIQNYDNIIFDFGGVILDINPELSINAFTNLIGELDYQKIVDSNILWEFEKGTITFQELQLKINQMIETPIEDGEFIKAWCAMLLDYHPERINHLKQLAQTHKLFMLSNTNQVHFDFFSEKLNNDYGTTFDDLFHKVYLSYKMGLIKPDIAIYEQVISEQKLDPTRTLFIEDTKENAKAANDLGIHTLVIPRNDQYYNFFKY